MILKRLQMRASAVCGAYVLCFAREICFENKFENVLSHFSGTSALENDLFVQNYVKKHFNAYVPLF